MYSTPLVSVGLFVYNGERFLEEALHSILNQTFTDFELIISDNASTDRTGEIAEAYAKRDNRIRYYRSEKNMGAGWNARRVYELATGKYFKWAAVDDLLEPDLLRRCVEILESDPDCVVAYARTKEVDENGTFIKNYVTPMKADLNDPVARFRAMMQRLRHVLPDFRRDADVGSASDSASGHLCQCATECCWRECRCSAGFTKCPSIFSSAGAIAGNLWQTLPVRLTQPRFRLTNRRCILPPPEWWDPAKTRALTFPEFRQLLEFFLSIYRAPLGAGQKLRCYSMLLPWII